MSAVGEIYEPRQPPRRIEATAVAVGALTLVGWASAFPGIRVGLTGFGPVELGALRFAVAALPAALALLGTRWDWPTRGEFLRLALCGLLMVTLYTSLLNAGERTVTGAAASFIANVAPILIAFGASWLLKERFGVRGWLGTLVSFAGVGVIAAGEGGIGFGSGALLVLGAVVASAAGTVVQKPLLARHAPLSVTAWILLFGALFLSPALPEAFRQAASAPLPVIEAVVFLGFVPSFCCYAGWSFLLSRLPAARAANLLYCIPPVATMMGVLWLGETPSLLALAGGTMAL
ncbi:MAG TPA: DMT family transporter, partial [Stellaceae bacterium]|nr:DMT family transporter [Stellaceae bacterium]